MKLIIHAPAHVASRAAGIAAEQWADGALADHSIIVIVSGDHCFTIKRNKSSVSVWHFDRTAAHINSDSWEVA